MHVAAGGGQHQGAIDVEAHLEALTARCARFGQVEHLAVHGQVQGPLGVHRWASRTRVPAGPGQPFRSR
ncbi:hypothetical protein [Streptomyces sp. SCL15-6]|uniref:hypothetical protein n=1 Tax=Streptomyces sp. SCL15-6 TaxID=2967222 RepID=UPI00296643FC|nr:hypothetical protein [Streptomyces sp. SCL15-6]